MCVLIVAGAILFYLLTPGTKSHEQVQRELAGFNDPDDDRLTEVLIQSDIVGDKATHDAVLGGIYRGPFHEQRSDGAYLSLYDNLRILKIAGINRRDRINRYTGQCMCALVPEPENEFDPNAIKIIAEDRHHLGYIPSHQTDMVRSWVGNRFPYHCTAQIHELIDESDGHKFYDGRVYIVTKDKGE